MGSIMELTVSCVTAFIVSFILTWRWISVLEEKLYTAKNVEEKEAVARAFFGKDMNKYEHPLVVRYGGIWAVIGTVFGYLILEAYHTYIGGGAYRLAEVFAVVTLLLLGGFIGFLDDVMGWKIGISPKTRILSTLAIAIPLSVVKAGVSTIYLPLLGRIDLGVYYSLVLVPIGVMGASNAFNMLAGYNGLEAGMAAITLSYYAIYALHLGRMLSFKLSVIALAAIIGFLYWNKPPARTFPGNGFTYAIGALLAAIVIIGNYEKFGVALFALYFLELALFIRGLLNGVYKETFGIPQPDGSLELPYDKIYSVTHLAIYILKRVRGRATEKGVTILILAVQAVIGLIALAVMW